MLKWFYLQFGFTGSILISLFGFILFIFWISGLAGINEHVEENGLSEWKLYVAVLFPPFPLVWLLIDMWQQNKYMSQE